jgi:hypothetical protein
MIFTINTIEDFKKIIAHEPHYGSPVLPYSQKGDFKELNKIFEGKRVAIVGPSPSLIGQNKGKEIDDYDIVCKVGWMYNMKDYENYGKRMDVLFNGCFPDADPINKFKNLKNVICPIKPCLPGIRDVHNRDIWKHYNYLKNNLPNVNFYNIGLLSCKFDNIAKTRATLGTFAINYLLYSSASEIGIYGFTWYNNEGYHKEYGQQKTGTHGYSYDLEKNLLANMIRGAEKKIYINKEVGESLNICNK